MKKDIGFWNTEGMYIPDVQEVDEMEIGKEITNADGSRNWEANILLNNVKRLEQENERLKEENKLIRQLHKDLSDKLFEFQKIEDALQEIKEIVKAYMP